MRRCFTLALKGQGKTAPNPLVGSVIVYQGRIIGEGWHHSYGGPHAEVHAIRSVKDSNVLHESTLYVNLEPCSHTGKTPPCADLILASGIKNVVICNTDPNPLVSGRGIQLLRDKGVNVIQGVLEPEGYFLNRRFFIFHKEKRPYIILKWAESSDGFIAGSSGRRVKISSALSDILVHKWRSEEQAILVGYRTALHDNPRLNVRHVTGKNPLRMVYDPKNQLPDNLNIYTDDSPILTFTDGYSIENGNKKRVSSEGMPFLDIFKRYCVDHQILSVFVEGGAATHQLFIDNDFWDEIRIIRSKTALYEGVSSVKIVQTFTKSQRTGYDEIITHYKSFTI